LRLCGSWRLCAEPALFAFVALEGRVPRKDAKNRKDAENHQQIIVYNYLGREYTPHAPKVLGLFLSLERSG